MNSVQGILFGFIVGIIDCVMYLSSGATVTVYDATTALTFWSMVGWVIHAVKLNMPFIMKGLVVTFALNIPWAINFSALGVAAEVLPFMLVFGLFAGIILGWLSSKSLFGSNKQVAQA